MNTALPITEIKGEKLTSEQQAYLEGLFAGLVNRGFSFGDTAPVAAGKPEPANLIFEERVKRELHPLDAYPLLAEHAQANKAPERENVFRFKWQGLFYLSPHTEAFMCRLRIPAGQIKAHQFRELANIARELTTGHVQITTRANIQLRLIQPKDAPEVLRRIQTTGLHTRGAGADNIRNITANPTAGIDPRELIDVSPFCHELAQFIINNREFYDLPRKFNIAFDGGGLIGVVEDTNDIGLKATRVNTQTAGLDGARPSGGRRSLDVGIEPGVYFRIKVGGATGHQAFARDLGVAVRPEELVKVAIALTRVYIANGNRGDRKKARLKHLLETWSLERYLGETEKLLGFQLPRCPEESQPDVPSAPHSHVGVFPQKQKGLHYMGVAIPVGQLTPKQMIRLAELAEYYGSGDLRLTVWQNLVLPNIPEAYVETVKKALVRIGLDWRQSNLRSGLIACTGNSYCKFASSNTKGHARELADFLEKRVALDQPINIHLTGCPNSCAQHYMGDIGLLGAKVKVSGETVEGYHVFVGGGFGQYQAVGRQIFQGISFEQLKPTLEKVINAYMQHRSEGESFRAFTQRHDLNTLQQLFT